MASKAGIVEEIAVARRPLDGRTILGQPST
jgi:hypothetical protein